MSHERRESGNAVCLPALVMTVAALMLPVPAAHAIPITFELNLSGANEVPPVVSPGTGSATVVLDPTAQTLQISATFSGLTSNTTAAHIHCCAPLGTNAIVATLQPAFPEFPIQPMGVTAFAYPPHVLDLTMASSYNMPFITAHGGTRRGSRGGPDHGNSGRTELFEYPHREQSRW
jgi:hypothetical protein